VAGVFAAAVVEMGMAVFQPGRGMEKIGTASEKRAADRCTGN
jgi:hypothetical protein